MSQEEQPRKRNRWVGFATVVVIITIAIFFRGPLIEWFAPGTESDTAPTAVSASLTDEQVEMLSRALESYEAIRNALATDDLRPVSVAAEGVASAIDDVISAGDPKAIPQHLVHAHGSAESLRSASSLEEARGAFAELGAALIPIAATESRLQNGWVLFECPMVTGFNYWIQHEDEPSNPYMGQAMSTCATRSDWKLVRETATDSPLVDEIAYWTCAMHPSVKQSGPGACPICGMDLLPVTSRDAESGVLLVDSARRTRIGMRTGPVERRAIDLNIRATGRTMWDETKLRDVTLKLGGWVEKLYVDQTGQRVRRGQIMFTLYSPELYVAQQELLLAIRSQESARSTTNPTRADYLVRASREKLRLWGLADAQIDAIADGGTAIERMPIRSPYDGFVIEKNIVEGASVMPGEKIFRIGALEEIWIEADVYESDLAALAEGQPVVATLPYLPESRFEGTIAYIYPYLDPSTRTGRIRVVLPNPDFALKPEMYADVNIAISKGLQLVVPEEAVVQTGPRQLVFLDLGDDRILPREVHLGFKGGGVYQVLSGLAEGDMVVTSANFLIASESRIRSAEQFWSGEGQGGEHAGH